MSGTGSRPPPTAASSSCTSPTPSRWSPLAGTRRVLETAHKLIGSAWGDEGTTREQRAWTADPDLVRRLDSRPGLLHPPRRGHLRPGRPAQALPAHPAARRPPRPDPPARVPEPRHEPAPAAWPGPTRPAWMTSSDPEPPDEPLNPFEALGLPARPDLPDEQVRAAWRAIAAATHPDRAGRRGPGPLHRRVGRLRRAAHPVGPRPRPTPTWSEQADRAAEADTGPLPVIPADGEPARRPAAASAGCGLGVPGPGPPRPPAPPAHPRRDRRGAVPGRAAT